MGLEDNLLMRKGEPASNEALVRNVVAWSKELGREVASPDEAREILQLSP